MKILITSAIIILLFSFTGCYYDSKEYLYPQLSSPCDTSNVTYSGCVVSILSESCLGCHSGSAVSGGGIKLGSYPDVKIQVDNNQLLNSIKWTGGISPMPKGYSKISNSNIAIIEKWINAGAPNN